MKSILDPAIYVFFLGTILASTGWVVTHIVEEIISIPTLAYSIEYEANECFRSHSDDHSINVVVRNLSRTDKLSDLTFLLRLPVDHTAEFTDAEMRPVAPAYRSRHPVDMSQAAVTYPSTHILPGTELNLAACYVGSYRPTFHIKDNDNVVRYMKSGFLTLIIRGEAFFLLTLLVLWMIIVPVILGRWYRQMNHDTDGERT